MSAGVFGSCPHALLCGDTCRASVLLQYGNQNEKNN